METLTTMKDDGDSPMFPQFQKLPEKIRSKIWALNLPGPRIVEVVEDKDDFYGAAGKVVNLSVCRESRKEALKTHPLSFSVDYAAPLIPFNFETDTLLLGRKLRNQQVYFRRYCEASDLGRVQYLMVDAYLQWGGVRTCDSRGWRLCCMSLPMFGAVKEYTCIYTKWVDPLPIWAEKAWFPKLRSFRTPMTDPVKVIKQLKAASSLEDMRIAVPENQCREHRFGGISEFSKFDPAIKWWKIPKVFTVGVTEELIASFGYSDVSSWAQIVMDRAIEDIFD